MAASGNKNIRGLDIAVNDALGMRCIERVGNFYAEIEHSAPFPTDD